MSDETTHEPPEEPQEGAEAHSFEEGQVLPERDEPGSDDRLSDEVKERIEERKSEDDAA